MIAKIREAQESEKGFTLVELLVVIIIIGILAAVAIPAFLNQRQRANDSAVQADIKNVATQVETALVESPNATSVAVATSSAGVATITVQGVTPNATVNLTSGVTIASKPNGTANGYILYGAHTNGKQFKNAAVGGAFAAGQSVLVFDSATGGVKGAKTLVAGDLT